MQKKKELSSETFYGELGQVFNFTTGDLEANRAGFLSYRQKQIRQETLVAWGLSILVGWIMLLAAETIGIFFVIGFVKDLALIVLFSSLIIIVPNLCLFGLLRLLFAWHGRELRERRIEKMTTRLKVELRPNSKWGEVAYLMTDNMEFLLEQRARTVEFKPLPYCIYFLPESKTLLSIEQALPE